MFGLTGKNVAKEIPIEAGWLTISMSLHWTPEGWKLTRSEQTDGPEPSDKAAEFGRAPQLCATSREFAVPLGSLAWGLTRHLVALDLSVCVGIMMVLQESRRSIMIYADPSLPSAGLTCGNGR
ncbi:hypothetical protein [Streptomyces sp. NPDC058424]|uniref:hypothetical protein n=1 Tax=Streptomyces sp. NPDC058424 TaxID=3346491 RepID=UPI003653D0F5